MKEEEEQKPCDFCGEARAVLYCRADAARLCLSCDRHVHLANTVSSKHPRSLLCDSCASSPAAILCVSHGGEVLCSNCDFEAHVSVAPHHERRPVEAFAGCPSGADLGSLLGVGKDEVLWKKEEEEEEEEVGAGLGFVWEIPQVVRLDDLIVPSSDGCAHGFQALGVPPLPKNRNLACGKQKDEILKQLRKLISSESQPSNDCEEVNAVREFQPLMLPVPNNDQHGNLHSGLDANITFSVTQDFENRNLACGKQKDETLKQLRKLISSESQPSNDCEEVNAVTEFQSLLPHNNDQHDNLYSDFNVNAMFSVTPDFEASELQWNNINWNEATDPAIYPNEQHPESFSAAVTSFFPDDVSNFNKTDGYPRHDQVVGERIQQLTPKLGLDILCPDRDSVITRYKEKRKARRYDKLIRYESRKARADSRVRVKGRFAKVTQVPKP